MSRINESSINPFERVEKKDSFDSGAISSMAVSKEVQQFSVTDIPCHTVLVRIRPLLLDPSTVLVGFILIGYILLFRSKRKQQLSLSTDRKNMRLIGSASYPLLPCLLPYLLTSDVIFARPMIIHIIISFL